MDPCLLQLKGPYHKNGGRLTHFTCVLLKAYPVTTIFFPMTVLNMLNTIFSKKRLFWYLFMAMTWYQYLAHFCSPYILQR